MYGSQTARHLDYNKLLVYGMISAEEILFFIIALVPWTLVILFLAALTKKIIDIVKDEKEKQ